MPRPGRVGMVITATLFGMALGGWLSGAIFDLTGSYHAAFLNGIGWNLLNLSIAAWLARRAFGRPVLAIGRRGGPEMRLSPLCRASLSV